MRLFHFDASCIMMVEVAGNCFGKRMALENLHATEMRKANDEAGQNRQSGGCQGSCALVVFCW